MAERYELDDLAILLASVPPTPQQRRLALAVVGLLLVVFAVTAPFAATPLPRLDAFIPSLETTIFVTDLITSILLFSQFAMFPSRALLLLANGYLFTALIVIPHALTFPYAFSPTGLLGAGLQSTAWLYFFWHFSFPATVLGYAWLKDADQTTNIAPVLIQSRIGWSAATVIILVCGLTWLATAGDKFLPRFFLDRTHVAPLATYVAASNVLIGALALALLWIRRRSILDQWLMVVAVALVIELTLLTLTAVFDTTRFSLGFYTGRLFSLVTSTVVLAVLLAETARLYGRLVHSNIMLQGERANKLMNLEAMAASISHEVRQPLTGMTLNGSALLRYLGDTPPKLEKARSAAEKVIAAGHRISQILDDIRNLFGTTERASGLVNMNDLALEALRALDGELKNHNIVTRTHLKPELPPTMGHTGQLQQVIVNLIQNAIDAMDSVEIDRRVLQVRTEHNGGDAISITIEDTGPGIDPKKSDDIFGAFFTTKPHGMGLGLAICRMIVERPDGELLVSSADPQGAVFRIKLPQMKLPH